MGTWNQWQAGERKQLDQFHDLQMFGDDMARPLEENAVILRLHWQYHVKRDGQQRARQCCNGPKRAAPILYALAKTYSSCVEHPIQRQFLALATEQTFLLFGEIVKIRIKQTYNRKTFFLVGESVEIRMIRIIRTMRLYSCLTSLSSNPRGGGPPPHPWASR